MKQNKHTWILLPLIFAFLTGCSCQSAKKIKMEPATVKELNLEKYMGTWYEIARYPHRFEKDLVGVTATYTLFSNGKISVVNQGYKNSLDGKLSIARGKAKLPDKAQPGKLKVSFFWIFYADYYVLELDENYTWAVVGSSSDNYLWILSRTPKMADSLYQLLIEKIRARGYDPSRLEKVLQPAF